MPPGPGTEPPRSGASVSPSLAAGPVPYHRPLEPPPEELPPPKELDEPELDEERRVFCGVECVEILTWVQCAQRRVTSTCPPWS